MMKIYVPFNDADLIFGAEQMGGAGNAYIHGKRGMTLSGLDRNATLFVMAHGRYSTGDQIAGEVPGYVWGKRTAYLTAAELSTQLISDGLKKDFGDVRLLVCWGGYSGGDSQWGNHTLKRDATKAPFAGQLCSAMKADGFKRIIVSGYTGEVMFPSKGTRVLIVPSGVWLMNRSHNLITTEDNGQGLGALTMTRSTTAGGDKERTVGTLDNADRTVWH